MNYGIDDIAYDIYYTVNMIMVYCLYDIDI